jgi:NADH-ubiquinone oxidoreductase chain 3
MLGSTIFFIIFIPFLAFVLLGLSVLLGPHSPYEMKNASYECGFSGFLGQNRTEFAISFFIFGLVFLLLDLEILLVYPYTVSSYNNSSYGLFVVIIFLLLLTIGFVFEMAKGALKINSKQTNYLSQQDTGHLSGIKVKGRKNSLNLYNHQQRSYSTVASRRPLTPIAKVFPKKIYKNADTDKAKILIDNKNKAGIYSYLNCGLRIWTGKGALAIQSKQTGYLESSNIKMDRERNSKNLYKSRSSSSVSPRKGFNHTFSGVKRFFSNQSTLNNETVVPVRVYNNMDLYKSVILRENKGKSGVYRLTNLVNGKVYIGSGVNLSKRFTSYYSYSYISDYKRNMTIYKAILKYGYLNFTLEILEYCDLSDTIKREQHYLDLLNPEYNILKTAGSNLGYKHTEETLARMSKAALGRKHTEETIAKISAKIGAGMAAFNVKTKGKPVLVTNLTTQITTEYASVREAAKKLNISRSTALRYLKKQEPFKGLEIKSKPL